MSANLQEVNRSDQQRLEYILRRLDEAVIKVIAFYARRSDVRIVWHKQSLEQRQAFEMLTHAINAYAMNILSEEDVKKYFQSWIKTLEVAKPVVIKQKVVLRMVPANL